MQKSNFDLNAGIVEGPNSDTNVQDGYEMSSWQHGSHVQVGFAFTNDLPGDANSSYLVVAVYGVLFMDWGSDVPFRSVCISMDSIRR